MVVLAPRWGVVWWGGAGRVGLGWAGLGWAGLGWALEVGINIYIYRDISVGDGPPTTHYPPPCTT